MIITAIALAAAVFAVYRISTITGSAFYDFCRSAVSWVLIGIGVAFAAAYSSINENPEGAE